MKRKLNGFTLGEVMTAMVILAILAAAAIPSFTAYLDYNMRKEEAADGQRIYMAANAAAAKTATMHSAEFEKSLTKNINYVEVAEDGTVTNKKSAIKYGRVSSGGLYSVAYSKKSGNYYDPYASFLDFSKGTGGDQIGDAYIARYTLEALDAYDSRHIESIQPKYRFTSGKRPAGDITEVYTPTSYHTYINSISYTYYDEKGKKQTAKCEDAGIIICYGKNPRTGVGEVIFTEYGDARGDLIICINPIWYPTLKEELSEVRYHPLSEAAEREALKRGVENPIVLTIKDGKFEAASRS